MKAVSTFGFFVLLIFLVMPMSLIKGETSEAISVIPRPVKVELREGTFALTPETLIVVTEGAGGIGEYLAELLAPATTFKLKVKNISQAKRQVNCIILQIAPDDGNCGDEGYRLSVDKDKVVVSAPAQAGIFYGIQSLRQLLPVEIERSRVVKEITVWQIPCVEIKDEPRFQWRGLMIDCSRTFWSKAFILRTIRLMSLYKLNRLHLHLTDDQGWRLEIKKHPALTEIGSKFAEKYNEPAERQGYYSQSDMREIIAYGKRHNVTVVPEIEMPGHSIATLTVYPELSCSGGPFEIFPFFKGPGINKDILCAGNEKTFEFLEDVLGEVVDLFGCEFIHIGGDEAPKDKWRECSKCQWRMKQEGLDDEDELQSYFIKRIEEFLNSKGKRLIGWDEILEGGLAPNAAVMSWRGTRGGIAAARAGHDVVMSPTSHCYFDYDYEKISTMKAYSYEPVPAEVTGEQIKHILGAQANFWSHIDRTEAEVDKQIYPRLLALAEVTWSPKGQKDEMAFAKRVRMHCSRLKELGVRYFEDPSVVQPDGQEWRLVWSDEFNYEGLPDKTKWDYEQGFIRNEELQYYGRARKENIRVASGMLVIEGRKERFRNAEYEGGSKNWKGSREFAEYTSASIITLNRASWTYGRIEVRAKLPRGRGVWPAIWTLGTNIGQVGWPRCGEIDIMEYVGFDPNTIHANIHTAKYNHVKKTNKGSKITVDKPYDSFHIYSVEWDEKRIAFFVDDNNYFTFENEGGGVEVWPFDTEQYLILNLAIGGAWGGQKGIDESIFPQRFCIDYVRVYEKKDGRCDAP
ncbi:MAG: family 20 glycosylhydrolase [Planctomycetota bacterium]